VSPAGADRRRRFGSPAYGGTTGAAANGSRQLGLLLDVAPGGTVYGGVTAAFTLGAAVALVGDATAMGLLRSRVQPVGSTDEISPAASEP
jgi:hypothetical protein